MPSSPETPAAATPVSPSASASLVPDHTLAIRFTGTGSEYFRIWLVNLLLTIITLGIYYPWARVRKLQYFASNTWIGNERFGEHALEFLGDPKRMMKGYAVMAVLFVVYLFAGELSETAGTIALLALIGGIPLLSWASLRFRLGNTRWRGLRFSFAGTAGGAYAAYVPLLLAFTATIAITVVAAFLATASDGPPPRWLAFTPLIVTAAGGIGWMWSLFRVIRYRQDHLRFGDLQTRLDLTAGPYLRLLVKAGLLTVALLAATGVAAALLFWLLSGHVVTAGPDGRRHASSMAMFYLLPLVFLLSLGWQVFVRAWLVAREQNLVWSHTVGKGFAFESDLGVGAYVARNLLNVFLIIVTLGFYQPFAAVALARLRLEAVSVRTTGDPADVVALAGSTSGATGDAGADVFGIDIGL